MTVLKSIAKNIAYGALHVSTRGQGVKRNIGGEQVRFPARWCRYYEPNYEPDTFAWLRQNCKAGYTILDVGAHIGLFSVVMARLVGPGGHVFSFEPTPSTRAVLEETVRINGCERVVSVRGEAVSRASGRMTFYDTGAEVSSANSLIQTEHSKEGISVDVVSIDDFAANHSLSINCLKIDAEGAELDVLLGAQHTFGAHRPSTHLALHPFALPAAGATLAEIWDVIASYRMKVQYAGRVADKGWFCGQENLFDVILAPSE